MYLNSSEVSNFEGLEVLQLNESISALRASLPINQWIVHH